MTRSEGRNLAFELLYSLEIQKVEKEEQEEQIQLFLQENTIEEKNVVEYIKQTINGITLEKAEIEKMISQNLKEKWDMKCYIANYHIK